MDRRHPGYLIPSMRRLQHICGISSRNLSVDVVGTSIPDVYFTLSTASGTPMYQSELAAHTTNPNWLPIEWSTSTRCGGGVYNSSGRVVSADDVSSVKMVSSNSMMTILETEPILCLRIYARCTKQSSRTDGIASESSSSFSFRGTAISSSSSFSTTEATTTSSLNNNNNNSNNNNSNNNNNKRLLTVDGDGNDDDDDTINNSPLYFPKAFHIQTQLDSLLIEHIIDVRELCFIPFDLFYALAIAQSLSTRGAGFNKSGAGRGGNTNNTNNMDDSDAAFAAIMPDAAGYTLDALPMNLIVFSLDDGQYVLGDAYRLLKPDSNTTTTTADTNSSRAAAGTSSGGPMTAGSSSNNTSATATAAAAAAAAASASSAPSQIVERHDLRRGFDAINRLMQLHRDTLEAEKTTQSALEAVANALESEASMRNQPQQQQSSSSSSPQTSITSINSATLTQAERVAQLAQLRASLLVEMTALEEQNAIESKRLAHDAACIRDAASTISSIAKFIDPVQEDVAQAREEVSSLRSLVAAKQLQLLAELRGLYPIQEQEKGKRYSIRGIVLPPEREFGSSPEEQVSTALGYTCHLISLTAKYLSVPLRYAPLHMSSRSTIRDEVLAHTREWPFYWKGADKDAIRVGFKMLQRDVKQVLASQGVLYVDSAHILANMSKLFTVLLDVPLPDTA